MLLEPHEAQRFFKLHRWLMCWVNDRLKVVPPLKRPEDYETLPLEERFKLRQAFLGGAAELIQGFVVENPANFTEPELAMVACWRHQIAGRFYVFRYLKKHAIFLSADGPATAYAVLALSDRLEDLIGPYLPVLAQTVLMPWGDKIVYDGLLSSYNITFGGGIRRSLNASYQEAKQRFGIVTSLPIQAHAPAAKKAPAVKARRGPSSAAFGDVQPILQTVAGMMEDFCREHLNEEYSVLCGKLAEKLARKRPSPLLSGQPVGWACGIVRTIGWVNFLDDRTTTPYMKLADVDDAFGVSHATAAARSKAIRSALKTMRLDPAWTLPSQMDNNLLVWMLEVNGFLMDMRHAPREVQEIAFRQGLIPYIPADRDASPE